MLTRRSLAFTAFGAMLAPSLAFALPEYAGGQRPTLIPGTPPHIDFGHQLVIPASGEALKTLWEGDDRYLAFGIAASIAEPRAADRAEIAAIGTMQMMLLTRAFAPERLSRYAGCGWRSASGHVTDLVQGTIALPGRPYRPYVGQGAGNAIAANDDGTDADSVNAATCVYMVMKRDAGLDYVRRNARLVCADPNAPAADPAVVAREICPPGQSAH